jgi:hypothetical protein
MLSESTGYGLRKSDRSLGFLRLEMKMKLYDTFLNTLMKEPMSFYPVCIHT